MNDIGRAIVEGKARSRLAAFVGVMSVLLVMVYLQDRTPRVRTDSAAATVLEVRTAGWQVKLATGETVWIHAASGVVSVKSGDSIPVRIETYESGNRRVAFDRDRWMSGE